MSEKLNQAAIEPFEVGAATFGDGRLTLIAGPCVVESRQHVLFMARECRERARDAGLDYVFKASYDKANRSSGSSYRGPGMREGLEALRAVKEETGLPVLTDVHAVSQVEEAARVADVLQIPAFLCAYCRPVPSCLSFCCCRLDSRSARRRRSRRVFSTR